MLVQLFLSAFRSDGAYWQVFGVKEQALVACHASYPGCAAAKMLEGVFSRIIRMA